MFKSRRGQSLIEILVAVLVGFVIVGGVALVFRATIKNSSENKKQENVYPLAQELLNRVKSITDSDWHKLYNLDKWSNASTTYYAASSSSTWNFFSGSEIISQDEKNYSRYFFVENVARDKCGIGDVTTSATTTCTAPGSIGVADDPSTQKITAVVLSISGEELARQSAYVSRLNNVVFYQNNWAGGGAQAYFPTTTTNTLVNNKFITSSELISSTAGELKLKYLDFVQSTSTDNRISAGGFDGCAVRADGNAYCWGDNSVGTVGDGYNGNYVVPAPSQVKNETNTDYLKDTYYASVNGSNACAIKKNGDVYCWGSNVNDQLGYSHGGCMTSCYSNLPVKVSISNIKQISVGTTSVCAVDVSNDVWCWGNIPRFGSHPSPFQISGLSNVKKVAVGETHACALKNDGTVWCWGGSYYLTSSYVGTMPQPYQIPGIPVATDVNVSKSHTCIIAADTTIYCWGDVPNLYQIDRNPVHVRVSSGGPYIDNVVSVSAGGDTTYPYTCAVKTDGTVFCWGVNTSYSGGTYYGQLGTGDNNNQTYPTIVKNTDGTGNLSSIVKVVAGLYTTCAGALDGSIYCWGANKNGALGIGVTTPNYKNIPTQVIGIATGGRLTQVKAVSAGMRHSCAAKINGSIVCWGNNDIGQLGLGYQSYSVQKVPAQVKASTAPSDYFQSVTQISSGQDFSCATVNDGSSKVFCWGLGSSGELGNGNSTTNQNIPVRVKDYSSNYLAGISQTNAGSGFACALKTDGSSYCWGNSAGNKLGGSTQSPVWAPTIFSNLKTINGTSIDSCGVNSSGNVYCWGSQNGASRQIGISGVSQAAGSVGISYRVACAVKTDSTVWCWSISSAWNNDKGQLGIGNNIPQAIFQPVQVVAGDSGAGFLTGVKSISVNEYNVCAVKINGELYCWGDNYAGQLGLGGALNSPTYASIPRRVVGVGNLGYLTNVDSVSISSSKFACAVLDSSYDYAVVCWGNNGTVGGGQDNGLLGDGLGAPHSYPAYVIDSKQDVSLNINLYSPSGTLESSIFDTQIDGGVALNNVSWKGNLPSGTKVGFQIAASNNSSGPWNYFGPAGTSDPVDIFSGSPNVFMPLNISSLNNYRYFRYKTILYADTSRIYSPTINKILINYSQ